MGCNTMGFRYRKSIKLGAGFRINLSKSGIGYSWGTKGYRVTKTAKGTIRKTYSIPGTGISYVQESGKKSGNKQQQVAGSAVEGFREIESADVSQFQTAESSNIVAAIQRTLSWNSWGTILIWCMLLMLVQPMLIILPIIGIVLKVLAHSKAVVNLEYSLDAEANQEYARRIDAWSSLAACEKEWQVTSERLNTETRNHAGAKRSVDRMPCTIKQGHPFYIKTNVETIEIKLKKETLILLPDKIFVVQGRKVGLVDYSDVSVSVSNSNFRESEKVPKDARVIGTTWQFVNKNGTPDKRHKNNRQIPICLYGVVRIRSAQGAGLNVELMLSDIQKAEDFGNMVQ